jgi:hypothetical protein
MFNKTKNYLKKAAKGCLSSNRMKTMALMLLVGCSAAMAQNSAGDYTAGTTALTQVTEEIAKYVPIVVKLCYAIAGVVAVVGAISVYISMNNEEQDVKNILVLQNRQETRRKEMKLNSLLHNTLCRYLNFPIFENVVLKNI